MATRINQAREKHQSTTDPLLITAEGNTSTKNGIPTRIHDPKTETSPTTTRENIKRKLADLTQSHTMIGIVARKGTVTGVGQPTENRRSLRSIDVIPVAGHAQLIENTRGPDGTD